MRTLTTVAAFAALAIAPAWTAGTVHAGKLLRLDGHFVKWGPPVPASGATVSYAIVDGYDEDAGARNCRRMRTLSAAEIGVRPRDLDRALAAALATWEAAADVVFVYEDNSSKADILIGIDADARGRAYANVRLHEVSPSRVTSEAMRAAGAARDITDGHPMRANGSKQRGTRDTSFASIAKARICLNAEQVWKARFDGNTDTYDVRYVLTHEIGHALGLDHPGAVGGIMGYRYVEGSYDLHTADIEAIRKIYGPPRRGGRRSARGREDTVHAAR